LTYSDEVEKEFQEFLGLTYPYEARPFIQTQPIDPEKILVFADPHEPYSNEAVFMSGWALHDNASVVLVAGDLGDYYSVSRFRKTRHKEFRDEVRSIFRRMEWLSQCWPDVRVMIGNHDNRPEKLIQDTLPTGLQILTERNLIKRLAEYFPNVSVVGQQLDGTGTSLSHIYQLGDAVFCHGELSRKQNTAILEYISNYLHRWGPTLNLKPWRVLCQAHNHRDDKTSKGREKWFMLPTACDAFSEGMEYIYGPRMIGEPPSVGYSVFYQKDGVTDYNRSHNFVIDYA
jgi:predicted phosphodiesterase